MSAERLFNSGYTDLVSVIPPGAVLIPGSHIAPEALGKAPGVRYPSGRWGGYDWTRPTTLDDVRRMDVNGANIGLRACNFPGIDIDITETELASAVASMVEEITGARHYRLGLPPKRLYPFRLAGPPFQRKRLVITAGETRYLVEVLADGQQYLMLGTHPSGRRYEWPRGLPPASALPPLSEEGAEQVLEAIAVKLDLLGYDCDIGGVEVVREVVDQASLRAPSLEALRAAVAVIPNTNDTHPTREDYITMAYAIKAAGAEWPEEAWDVFWGWARRWPGRDGRVNEEAQCKRDWDSLRPPYRIGWPYLLDWARQYGFDGAEYEFSVLERLPQMPERPASPAGVDIPAAEARYTEAWLADRLTDALNGCARYIPERGQWVVWDGSCWRSDVSSVVPSLARRTAVASANALVAQAAGLEGNERRALMTAAKQLSSRRYIESAVALASADSRLRLPLALCDTYPDLLATPAGVVDLRTGTISSARPELYITRTTSVAPRRGPATRWLQFLHDLCGGDREYVEYLHRLLGYWLTGHTVEHALWFAWGPGGNGKSTWVGTVLHIIGAYGRTSLSDVFLASQSYRHPTELAHFAGARLVVASELGDGRTWDEARIKMLTGGDRITARFLYRDPFEFTPECKILIVGNAQPELARVDDAIRRRFHLLPMVHRPERPDLHLGETLRAEAGEILQWMIDGAVEWYRSGLCPPRVVLEHTDTYIEQNDPFGAWLDIRCERVNENARVSALYEDWARWCASTGDAPGSIKKFSCLLSDRGFKRVRRADGAYVFGLKLRE